MYHGTSGAAVNCAVCASTITGCSSRAVSGSLPRMKKVWWCGLENAVPGNAMKPTRMCGACAFAVSSMRCSLG